MCGVVGVLYSDKDRYVEVETLDRMNNRIIHRGPDDAGQVHMLIEEDGG